MAIDSSEPLAALRKQFQEQVGERINAIRTVFCRLHPAAWRAADARELQRQIHSLTGSAGTFGMTSIADVSRQLETAIANVISGGQPPEDDAWQAAAQMLDRLEGIARIQLMSNAPAMPARPDALARPHLSPLIHLVEDDSAQAEFLRQILIEHGFRVRLFVDLADFSAIITAKVDEEPAAVVMDMMFPEGISAGANVIAELGLGGKAGIPVVFVSVRHEMPARLAAYRAGASRYLTKPVDSAQLCSILDDLTGRMPPTPFRVLLVDDDTAVLALHAAVLRQAGLEVLTVSEPLQCLELLEHFAPDVVVLDVYMPDASGPEIATVIREQSVFMNLPILFLSAESDMTKQLLALNLGGDDFLVKPVAHSHLISAVTARARRARQNTETTQRLRTILYEREREHLALDQHALVSSTDAAGCIEYANDNFCTVSGYAIAELLGQNHSKLKSGRHPPEFYRDMWTTLRSGNIWRGEICNRRKNGSLYWVSATITPFLDGDGKVYQYVSIRSDITALKESQETLQSSKERLRRGQIYANIGTWDWNIATGDLFWSERIPALFGYPEGELKTSYDNFLAAIHPDDCKGVTNAVNNSIEHGVPYEVEHRVVWPDGTIRWLLERGAAVRDNDGTAVQMLGVVQDVTARVEAERALVIAREEADRANEAKSEFLSSMSHELRTPMNAILGFSQLMDCDDALSEDHRDNVQEIRKAGEHLLELINEVLDLAKVESGHINLSLEAVEIAPVISECITIAATMADKRNIGISVGELSGATVRADRIRLKQVLINLLSNAVKYNTQGGTIRVDVRSHGEQRLRILVTDTGRGVPAERLAELFQPFNRLGAEATSTEGTGIGLTITQRIVELMGGMINVESTVGVGSTFWIELPSDTLPPDGNANDAAKVGAGDTPPGGDMAALRTILYVDDNPANLKFMAHVLGHRKHIRLQNTQVSELALEFALAHHPDLILLDINMPGVNGYQVLKLLKANRQLQAIPVVAVTANATLPDIARGKAAGFTDYVTKPIDITKFYALLDRLLAN